MLGAEKYAQFGGKHVESANLKNILGHYGIKSPGSRKPFTEAMCFGIAGGIGGGYSFCPSIPRHGLGSGVSLVGRYQIYATGPEWYQGCFDRLGITTHITETAAKGKAHQNLLAELEQQRPTIVWCGPGELPFLGSLFESCALYMHTFVVYAIDAEKNLAYGSDRPAEAVQLTLDELKEARARVCSHKNRTLSIQPPAAISKEQLQQAILSGISASLNELYRKPRMKTFSLASLESMAKMMCNETNKEGWGKAFDSRLLYCAFRDLHNSIETGGTGGGLYRPMYADFLDEAAKITGRNGLKKMATIYRDLGAQWTAFAENLLPNKPKIFKQTRELLSKKCQMLEGKGEKNRKGYLDTLHKLAELEKEAEATRAVTWEGTEQLREDLSEQIQGLQEQELSAAEKMAEIVEEEKK